MVYLKSAAMPLYSKTTKRSLSGLSGFSIETLNTILGQQNCLRSKFWKIFELTHQFISLFVSRTAIFNNFFWTQTLTSSSFAVPWAIMVLSISIEIYERPFAGSLLIKSVAVLLRYCPFDAISYSQIVASLLKTQAKRRIVCVFYLVIWRLKISFLSALAIIGVTIVGYTYLIKYILHRLPFPKGIAISAIVWISADGQSQYFVNIVFEWPPKERVAKWQE